MILSWPVESYRGARTEVLELMLVRWPVECYRGARMSEVGEGVTKQFWENYR